VRDMLIAATYDEYEETNLAERVLVDIMSKWPYNKLNKEVIWKRPTVN
jgi:hypothetical protein